MLRTRPIFYGALGAAISSTLGAFGFSWTVIIAASVAYLIALVVALQIAQRREARRAATVSTASDGEGS